MNIISRLESQVQSRYEGLNTLTRDPLSAFLDTLKARFGITRSEWERIKGALAAAKSNNMDANEDGLGQISPMLFIGSLGLSQEDFAEILNLALDADQIQVEDLPDTVLLDDADSRIVMKGCAVSDGDGGLDTRTMKLEITSKIDPGSRPLALTVRMTTSREYLMVNRFPIMRALPNLYQKMESFGLFTSLGASTKNVLVHRLVLAAGGVNVDGMEGDHGAGSSGVLYGGPSTWDARFEVLTAKTHEAHTQKHLDRNDWHHYSRVQKLEGMYRSEERDVSGLRSGFRSGVGAG